MRSSIILPLLATAYVATGAAVSGPCRNTHVNPIEAQVEVNANSNHVANTKRDNMDMTTSNSASNGSVLKILPNGTMVIDVDGEVEDLRSEASQAFKVTIPADLKIVIPDGGLNIDTDTMSITKSGAEASEKRESEIDALPCTRCTLKALLKNNGRCPEGSKACSNPTGEPEENVQLID